MDLPALQEDVNDKCESGLENHHEELNLAGVYADDANRRNIPPGQQELGEQPDQPKPGDQEIGSRIRVGHPRRANAAVALCSSSASRRAKRKR